MVVIKKHTSFNIGLSIAEPTDMKLWGISDTHIRDALMELTRSSINSGYRISYGGDIGYSNFLNFSEVLKEIVIRYFKEDINNESNKPITNFLAWHVTKKDDSLEINSISRFMNIVNIDKPKEFDHICLLKYKKVQKALSLTSMRQKMNEEINARVLLAGKITGSSGVYPGLIEEAYLALKAKKPVFLLGGFGGCTHKIIELIEKKRPQEITMEYQFNNDIKKRELINEYNELKSEHPECAFIKVNYEEIISFFESRGIVGLNNGLSILENRVLFETRNIKEMLRLLLKGLSIVRDRDNW